MNRLISSALWYIQRPHLYAGVMALCGYYDRRMDSSIQGEPLMPWEKERMSVHSPVDWAQNGEGLPLRLVHGTRDGPRRAQRLEEVYKGLGYPVELELHPAVRGVDPLPARAGGTGELPHQLGLRDAPAVGEHRMHGVGGHGAQRGTCAAAARPGAVHLLPVAAPR